MKKVVHIFLLASFSLVILGFYPVFKIAQYQIRKEIKTNIKKGVPEKDLHRILFREGDKIDWVKEGKEFRYKNKMFDIVRVEKLKNETMYFCLNDEDEEHLFSLLDELVKRQMHHDTKSTSSKAGFLMKIISQIYLPENLYHYTRTGFELLNPLQIKLEFSSVYPDTSTPPPKKA